MELLVAIAIGAAIYFYRKIKRRADPSTLGREVGGMAKHQLSLPFLLTSCVRNGQFQPPEGFFFDPYVAGFCISFVNTMRLELFENRTRAEKSRNAFILSALMVVDPNLTIRNWSDSWVKKSRGLQTDDNYSRGLNHASAVALALIGRIDQNSAHPLIVEARKLAPSFAGLLGDISTLMRQPLTKNQIGASGDTAFLTALHELTIGKHMRDSYPRLIAM